MSSSTFNSSSTFKFSVLVPLSVTLRDEGGEALVFEREEFYAWLWSRFSSEGLVGVHEGSVLSEEAAEAGFEADAWTLDSAEAPADRDWVSRQEESSADLYFSSPEEANAAIRILSSTTEIKIGAVLEQKPQDWDAEWKASFLNAGEGVKIGPFWKIVPPWVGTESAVDKEVLLRINPGAGFGTGTHETTQLCLTAIGEAARMYAGENIRQSLANLKTLDFGSGSGILSIGLALLGAPVDSVEVDTMAVDNARENAELNEVTSLIRFSYELPSDELLYDIVVANILRPVLIEFSEQLVLRLKTGGTLILSGLIAKDVPIILDRFCELLGISDRALAHVYEMAEWRSVVLRKFS
jgi:ribosomal protein L11 methyltransferase